MLGAQEPLQGLADKQVQEGGQGASLSDASTEGGRRRNETIHIGPGTTVSKQQVYPPQETRPKAHCIQHTPEETTVNCVVRLAEITKNHDGRPVL